MNRPEEGRKVQAHLRKKIDLTFTDINYLSDRVMVIFINAIGDDVGKVHYVKGA
jgi:hypothetical protein